MKTIALVLVLTLSAIGICTPWSGNAQPAGPSANGSYTFFMEDEAEKFLEFDANSDGQGNASGRMTFRDESRYVEREPDSLEDPREEPTAFAMTAELNTLTIENNRAVMSGVVLDASHIGYVGRWVQLVVEDGGDEQPDKVSWRLCQPEEGGWVPSDAEVHGDEGAWMSWWATDAEFREDVGIQSPNLMPGIRRGCTTFALSSYAFAEVIRGEGQIQVLP